MTKYRIVPYFVQGCYKVEKKLWWFPFWLNASGLLHSKARAEEYVFNVIQSEKKND